EHLKGFILDNSLTISNEGYAKAIAGREVWLTPTFYALIQGRREADAPKLLAAPEMRYVSLRRREAWRAPDPGGAEHTAKNQALLDAAVPIAMSRLLPLRPRWLAGT